MRRFLVGIPTRNEAENVGRVVADLDEGCDAYPDADFTLCVADGGSSDRTVERFLETDTVCDKVAIRVAGTGKGRNIRAMFEYSIAKGYDGLICVDADLRIVPAQWISEFVSQLRAGAGLVIANYPRPWNDANMSNHIAVPAVLASTGEALREPIAGDFACSRRFMEDFMAQPWTALRLGFGIDLSLLQHGLKIGTVAEARLTVGKHHGWRANTVRGIRDDMTQKIQHVVKASLSFVQSQQWPKPETWGDFATVPELDQRFARSTDPAKILAVAQSALVALQNGEMHLATTAPAEIESFDTKQWANILAGSLTTRMTSAQWSEFRDFFFIRIAETQGRLGAVDGQVYKEEARALAVELSSAVRFR